MYILTNPAFCEWWSEQYQTLTKSFLIGIKRDIKGNEEQAICMFYKPFTNYRDHPKDMINILHVPFKDIKRIWNYAQKAINSPEYAWYIAYEDNEYANQYIVETEKVKSNDNSNETKGRSETLSEEK